MMQMQTGGIRNDKLDQLEVIWNLAGISIYMMNMFQVHDIWWTDDFSQSLLFMSVMLPSKLGKYGIKFWVYST